MALYAAARRSITPATTTDNWTLTAGASKSGRIVEFSWGGEQTTTTAVASRVARSDSQTGNTTSVTNAKLHPNSPASGMVVASSFATTQPTLNTGDLFATSWNAHGGVVRWLAAPEERMVLIGAATEINISQRNTVTSGVHSYSVVWEED